MYAVLFVCLLLNGTSALFRPLVPSIVEIEHVINKRMVIFINDGVIDGP